MFVYVCAYSTIALPLDTSILTSEIKTEADLDLLFGSFASFFYVGVLLSLTLEIKTSPRLERMQQNTCRQIGNLSAPMYWTSPKLTNLKVLFNVNDIIKLPNDNHLQKWIMKNLNHLILSKISKTVLEILRFPGHCDLSKCAWNEPYSASTFSFHRSFGGESTHQSQGHQPGSPDHRSARARQCQAVDWIHGQSPGLSLARVWPVLFVVKSRSFNIPHSNPSFPNSAN